MNRRLLSERDIDTLSTPLLCRTTPDTCENVGGNRWGYGQREADVNRNTPFKFNSWLRQSLRIVTSSIVTLHVTTLHHLKGFIQLMQTKFWTI